MTGTILTYMQDREADGMVFVGPADAVTFCILSLCS